MGHGGVDPADGGLALPPGTDPAALSRYLNQLHDDFVETGQVDGPCVAWSSTPGGAA